MHSRRYPLALYCTQMRAEWYAQNLIMNPLSYRKMTFLVPKMHISFLKVRGNRVMNQRSNTKLVQSVSQQIPLGMTDGI